MLLQRTLRLYKATMKFSSPVGPRCQGLLWKSSRLKSTLSSYTDQVFNNPLPNMKVPGPRLQQLRKILDTEPVTPMSEFFASSDPVSVDAAESKFRDPAYYSKTRLPVMEASTFKPELYNSEEFFKVEQKELFQKAWQVVGYTTGLRRAGDTISTVAAGQPILVTKAKDGKIRGFFNTCRHRGARLVKKDGRYPVISCPYHRWGYALDGRLLATPLWKCDGATEKECLEGQADGPSGLKNAFSTDEVQNFNKKDYGLLPVRVETWGPYVYANISGDAPPLETYLGDLTASVEAYPFDELISYKSKKTQAKANWKLLAENFMEYYHLPSVHPELCEVSAVDDHQRAQGKGMYIGFVTYPLTNGGTPLDTDQLPAMPGVKGTDAKTGWFHHHFPNAFYFLLPHGLYSVIIEPTGPETSIEHTNLLIHPTALEAPDAKTKLDAMFEFYDKTNNQDLDICEEVQIGIRASDYMGGRMTYRFEETIHRFQNMVSDYMVGKPQIRPGDENLPFRFQTEVV